MDTKKRNEWLLQDSIKKWFVRGDLMSKESSSNFWSPWDGDYNCFEEDENPFRFTNLCRVEEQEEPQLPWEFMK